MGLKQYSRRDFMKASILVAAFGPTFLAMGNKIATGTQTNPNIVLIYADDVGYLQQSKISGILLFTKQSFQLVSGMVQLNLHNRLLKMNHLKVYYDIYSGSRKCKIRGAHFFSEIGISGDYDGLAFQLDNLYRSAQAGYSGLQVEVGGYWGTPFLFSACL